MLKQHKFFIPDGVQPSKLIKSIIKELKKAEVSRFTQDLNFHDLLLYFECFFGYCIQSYTKYNRVHEYDLADRAFEKKHKEITFVEIHFFLLRTNLIRTVRLKSLENKNRLRTI